MKKNNMGDTYFIITVAVIAVVVVIVIAALSGNRSSSSDIQATGELKIGDLAPEFSLPSTTGESVSLDRYQGKPVILYFNEGVGCQPCWQQVISLEKDSSLASLDIPLITISPSELSAWDPIISSNPIKTPILADPSSEVSQAYGMLNMKSSMHGGSSPGHTFLLLNSEHRVAWIGDYPQMNMPTQEIVKAIKDKLGRQ